MSKTIYGVTTGLLSGAIRHSAKISFVQDIIDDGTPYIVDSPVLPIPDTIRQFNCSKLSRLLGMDKEAKLTFDEEFGITGKPTSSIIYTMINGGGDYLPPVAIGFSRRMMHGDVGFDVGFSHGAALQLDEDDMPESVEHLLEYLKGKYAGELCFEIDANWNVSKLGFGHQPQYLSLLCEFYGMDFDGLLEWLVFEEEAPRHTEGVAVSTLVSRYPFPVLSGYKSEEIRADLQAEKHIWRAVVGCASVMFVTAHAECVPSARRRVFRTINRLRRYDDYIQYRTDLAYKLDFGEMQDAYERSQKKPLPVKVEA